MRATLRSSCDPQRPLDQPDVSKWRQVVLQGRPITEDRLLRVGDSRFRLAFCLRYLMCQSRAIPLKNKQNEKWLQILDESNEE